MQDFKPTIDLGNISKPINTLIEKISYAIGGVFKPIQIKRIAKAESQAEQIKAVSLIETAKMHALAENEIKEIQSRALYRFIHEETRKQINIEQITEKSFTDINEDAKPENMDNDWIMNFFNKCKLISDDEMQTIWAKVLAGEANNPGSYSKRTINFLSTIDKNDAVIFEKLCSFSWYIFTPSILIYNLEDKIYSDNGIKFTDLLHLDEIGLLSFEPLAGFERKFNGNELYTSYFTIPIIIKYSKDTQNIFKIGKVTLSRIGTELKKIVNSKPIPEFLDYVLQNWNIPGTNIYSPYPKYEVPIDSPFAINYNPVITELPNKNSAEIEDK